jgi:hypothetical protein
MSDKEALINWIRQLPDDLRLEQILAALRERDVPKEVTGLGTDEDYEWPAEDLTEEEWHQFVAHAWRDELEDSGQDIYTADDGAPVDGPGERRRERPAAV